MNDQGDSSGSVQLEFSRDLGLFQITLMGLGMMIGAGVFVGIGFCSGHIGPGGLLVTFALNGLVAIFSAMSFAELASAIPRAGGTYNFARIGFGRPASFLAGWMEWLAASAAGGFYAILVSKYTVDFFYGLGWMGWVPVAQVHARLIFEILIIGFFVLINFRGSSETGKIGAVFTIGQMLFVLSIGVVGFVTWLVEPERIANFDPFLGDSTWWQLLASMGVIYVAFEGFEVIAQAGDETIEPRKNIPKAILYSVFFVTLTYMLVAFATMVSISSDNEVLGGMPVWKWISSQGSHGDKGFSEAAGIMIPGWGKLLVTLAVIFSATSALNATIFSATRSSFALGRDGMLPRFFAKIHSRTKTPHIALAFTSILVVSIALSLDSKDGAATASILFLVLFFLVNLCVIRIRRRMGDELQYGYIMPLFPLFPILAIGIQAAMAGGIFVESYAAMVISGVWLIAGLAVYFGYARHHAIQTDDEIQIIREEVITPKQKHEYRIMVALANPANALQLVQNTYRICSAKEACVELIHMVPIPSQVPFEYIEKHMFEGREAIMETMLYLAPQYPVSTTFRYCRNPARGIVSAVNRKKTDLLIMGWHGRPGSSVFKLGSTVDQILEQAPCDVVMFKNCGGNLKFRKVLVPVAGGPNGALALETASMLADPEEGEVVAFTCISKGRKFDLSGYVYSNLERCHLPPERIRCEAIIADNIVEAILDKSDDFDLVVIGGTREGKLARMTHLPIPETVARDCDKPLVMCRAAAGIQSWIKRYI